MVTSCLEWGVGEIEDTDGGGVVRIRYYTSARSFRTLTVPIRDVKRKRLAEATRIYVAKSEIQQFGYILQHHQFEGDLLTYWVKLGGEEKPLQLREDQFSVRSSLPTDCSALEELKHFTQETPFFFERRNRLFHELQKRRADAGALAGLLSGKVLLLPHQMQVCARIGADPVMRYLLADEVGLGKTIEAGAALRQALIDAPSLRAAVFVPLTLQEQWRVELRTKFDLADVRVQSHEALATDPDVDIAVIDEAHRLVEGEHPIAAGTQRLARRVKHLLLLTATPGLHDPRTMLRLLELLDPEHYSILRLAEFEDRLKQRGELGRIVLALQSARTPAVIRRQVTQVAQLLSHDGELQQWAAKASSAEVESLTALRDTVLVHVGETYRMHRRLLRTRRKWVLAEQPQLARRIDVVTEYAPEEQPAAESWRNLEKWRQSLAARLPDGSTRTAAISAYLALAGALAAEPDDLLRVVRQIELEFPPEGIEVASLEALRDLDLGRRLLRQQEGFVLSIVRRLAQGSPRNRGVVFCPSAKAAKRLVAVLAPFWSRAAIAVATRDSTPTEAGCALESFHSGACDLFVTDQLAEEGLNLQAAQFMIWIDLPWSPLRLEQRTGRLDRIDRVGKIHCRLLVSGEDEAVHLDEAWRQLVVDGLGVLRGSISDLAHVVARELPRWQDAVFAIGPGALGSILRDIPRLVENERTLNDEQDVIDGLYWSAAERKALDAPLRADDAAEELEDALAAFLMESVRLKVVRREEDGCLWIGRDSKYDPLLPPEQIEGLRALFGRPLTAMRGIAVENPDCVFFRPGHASFDALQRLLVWDDRGRAFALWRPALEWSEPRVVFRCAAEVRLRLDPRLVPEWDELERASFSRMLGQWFPPMLIEEYLQPDGTPADARMIELCLPPYDNDRDINLGKHRAANLRDAFGAQSWAMWCDTAANAALARIRESERIARQLAVARQRAEQFFTQQRALVLVRQQAGWDGGSELARWDKLATLARAATQCAEVTLDTFGAYVLSALPIAPR